MYSLKHKKRVLSARFLDNLSDKQLENNVTDNMLFGKYNMIAKESNLQTIRSSYGFSIYLSMRIYKVDVASFEKAVLDSFITIRPGIV